jgi:uncharacterized membrane protein YjgN (DUF898 family)
MSVIVAPAEAPWSPSRPAPGPAAAPSPVVPVIWDGSATHLLGIGLSNLLLTLLTLGIYRFWGIVRIRREVWAHLVLLGDRLEFSGTGGELFRGFLKAMLVLVPVFIALALIDVLAQVDVRLAVAAGAGKLAVLIYLAGVARHAARRYVASRTRWRGIRFAVGGSPWAFGRVQLGWAVATVLTLGLARPWALAAETRWSVGRLHLGTLPVRFEGRGGQLARHFAAAALFGVLATVAAWMLTGPYLVPLLVESSARAAAKASPVPGPAVWMGSFAVSLAAALLLALPFILAAWFAYAARVMRWTAENTSLGGARFAMPGATGWRLARLRLGNALLLLVSFGLLHPVALARNTRFWAAHLRLDRAPDLSAARQAEAGPRTGEGMADLLDAGALGA